MGVVLLLSAMNAGALRQIDNFFNIERFRQVFKSATMKCRDCAFQVGVGGHDDNWQTRVAALNLIQKLQAVHAGHTNIGNQGVRQIVL